MKYVWVLTRNFEVSTHLYIPTLGGGRIGICYSEVFLKKIDKVEHAFGAYPVWLWEKQKQMGPMEWHGVLTPGRVGLGHEQVVYRRRGNEML